MKNIMKINIRIILAAIALTVAFACQEKEPGDGGTTVVEPIFPEAVKNFEVLPGEELEFAFTPNLDWELSLSEGSYQYFKLLDETGRQREKMSGKSSDSPITIKIWVNPLEEFDNNRSCTLTLTMGGKSEVVAEYMRPAKARVMTVYAAKIQDGEFVKDEAGAYVYELVEDQNVEIAWSAEESAFMMPVKVESNCNWDIDRASFPSWLELNVPSETMGVLELVLKGNSLQDASGKVVFTSAGAVMKEMNVSISSCGEMSVYSAKYESGDWVYVDLGYEYSAEPQDAVTMVWTGSDIRIPVKVESKCEWALDMPEWITAELDDVRAGEDHFVFRCSPENYPLDETTVSVSFKYAGQVIKTINLTIPGCRAMISYALGMSLSAVEFNYSGQYKTTSGYMDAPLKGSVTAPTSMVLRTVEIVNGVYAEAAPAWLNCELSVSDDTDTKLVLQTKQLEISVEENLTATQRSAYIFLLPAQVETLAELFEEDKCTVKEAYQQYVIPVVQAFLPADYLTPESTADQMAAEGAYLVKSEKAELYESFGATRYAYELKYENTWSSDVAKLYLTSAYETVEFYNADKQLVTDKDNYWIAFTDYLENKTFGAITIPTVRKDGENWVEVVPEAGTSYVVFKDAAGATLCVVEFTYAPKIVEPEPEPEPEVPSEPGVVVEDDVEDASQFFNSLTSANKAGASLVKIVAVRIPVVTEESTQAERDLKKYKTSLSTTLRECKQHDAPLYRLTYTKADTELVLNFTDRLKTVASMFTVNPYQAANVILVDGKTMEDDGGQLVPYGSTKAYNGKPAIKMLSFSSLEPETLRTEPIKVLFHGSDSKILLAIECVLNE